MIKIVYFDDNTATDYLNIYDGGEKIQTSRKMKERTGKIAAKAEAGVNANFGWLPFFGAKAKAHIGTKGLLSGMSLINTTISNTVLTDFLEKANMDERILKYEGYSLKAYKNSIAFFKTFTPFLKITKSDFNDGDGNIFDISKMDEAFESGKGYYELIAEKHVEEKTEKLILRFNIKAFRNNYGIADLSKMNLKHYAIKVGKSTETMLDISKEFNIEKDYVNSAREMISSDKHNPNLDVYDVVLAGIEK